MRKTIDLNDTPLRDFWVHGVYTDFSHYVTADDWTSVIEGTGTIAVGATKGGTALFTTDGTDNDHCYLHSTALQFDIGTTDPIMAVCRLKYTEVATNVANVQFGILNAAPADGQIADGGGIKASSVGALMHKDDGSLVWKTYSSADGTTTKTDNTEVVPGAGQWQTLMIHIDPNTGGDTEVTYFIDPKGGLNFQQLKDDSTNRNLIQHSLTTPSTDTACVFIGVQQGGGDAQTMDVDLIGAWQGRGVDRATSR